MTYMTVAYLCDTKSKFILTYKIIKLIATFDWIESKIYISGRENVMKYNTLVGACLVSIFMIGCSGKSNPTEDVSTLVSDTVTETTADAGSDQLFVAAMDIKSAYQTEDELYSETELLNPKFTFNIFKVSGENISKVTSLEKIDAVELNVSLSGEASVGRDGGPLSYQWKIVEKPAESQAELFDSNDTNIILKIDKVGDYIVELTVEDTSGKNAVDQVKVSLKERVAKSISFVQDGIEEVTLFAK